MSEPIRIMVDIETLSTRPDAVILSLGAVVIDSELLIRKDNGCEFYQIINRESQRNRNIEIGTVEFWLKNISMYPMTEQHAPFLSDTLYSFNTWITSVAGYLQVPQNEIEFWAKGTDFDFVILKDAYQSFGIPIPWPYNNVRDLRTVLKRTPKLAYSPKEDNTELHNALGDAKFQAKQLIQVIEWEKD